MAIQFEDAPQGEWGALGSILGGLGGALGGYAYGKYGGNSNQEELFVKSGQMTPDQYKIYRSLPPKDRPAYMNQIMKMNEKMRQGAIEAEEFKRMKGGTESNSGMSGVLGNLGGTQQQVSPQNMSQKPFSTIESAQRLLAGGVDPNRVKLITDLGAQQEKMGLARESLQAKKEAPHRAQVAKQVAEYQRRGELSERLIADYDAMTIMADNPDLRTGVWQQILTPLGIPTALQSDAGFVADKLIGDITIASAMKTTTPGKLTAKLLQEYAKINPSRLSSPQGMKDTLQLKKMAERVQKITTDKINEIIDDSPGGLPPINIIQRAQKEVRPQIEAIHEEEKQFVQKMVDDAKADLKNKSRKLKVGQTYKGQADIRRVGRYRDPKTNLIMVRNAEGTGYIPEGR